MTGEPTPRQRAAIEAPLGPVLVVAGPGAGKTFCLIHRVRHLIERLELSPRRILAVTFTNKAAEEIATRLHTTLKEVSEEVTRGTLHAICHAILREFNEQVGLRSGFGLADEEYQRAVLRRLRVPIKRQGQLLIAFGRHRLEGMQLGAGDLRLFRDYEAVLRDRNMVDFDDLIARTEALLRTDEIAAAQLRGRWDYVLVDEFQDLNPAQYSIVRRLAEAHRNLFVVGDDEQSIFSWPGANPRVLRDFTEDFGVSEVVLDHNRRCSVQIFEAARRLIAWNPTLFDKRIEAYRESPYDVVAHLFDDDRAETDWLIRDLVDDRAATGLGWGEYAMLYRKHQIGLALETRLVAEGVPCRLARGQALMDDPVAGYVIGSLRVVRSPDDAVAVEALAQQRLSSQLRQDATRAAASGGGGDLLTDLRHFARGRPRGDADARKAWRFVFHVENLRALSRSHQTLEGLVSELLSQRVSPARNPLEEHYVELSDPMALAGARHLAEQLAGAVGSGATVWIAPAGGAEIAILGMLRAADLVNTRRQREGDAPRAGDLVLQPGGGTAGPWALRVFKALQLLHTRGLREDLADFVAFDVETTDKDVRSCEVVEIAAVRVRGGEIVGRFHSLVAPAGPISAGATKVHGYSEQDLRGAPTFAKVWPEFRNFAGRDVLVAHNGQEFDVPLLRRLAEGLGGVGEVVFYDTLPLARSLVDGSAKLEHLARRWNIDPGRTHHALDDALMLARIVPHLTTLKAQRARKAALVNLLDYLGLGLALDPGPATHPEADLLRELARPYALGPYSDCLEFYAAELAASTPPPGAPPLEELIERIGGRSLMARLRARRSAAERYPASVARLTALVEASRGDTLAQRIDDLLARAALSKSAGVEADPHRVNLLTLHATKGLEFSRVYIVGVEDQVMP
ncbi:MAG: UvrD-helicase domain-containing protein, partial [Gemmatimonadales bacterium]